MQTHQEKHIHSSDILKDIVIGMADGLTVPFALAAGLSGSGAIESTFIVLVAGCAEIAAGSIAMSLGGYLAAKTAADHYDTEYKREMREIEEVPHIEAEEVAEVLRDFGVPEPQLPTVVHAIKSDPKKWADFMMRFELGLEKPNPTRLISSPLTIGLAYIFGGAIPLLPYLFYSHIHSALTSSTILTLSALFIFGAVKGYMTGKNMLYTALQTLLIGGTAAAAAFCIAKWIGAA